MFETAAAFHNIPAGAMFAQPHHSTTVLAVDVGAHRLPTGHSYRQAALTALPKPSQTTMSEKPKKVDWPQPVRDYVQRAFMPEHNVAGIAREDMEKKLKETITQANEQDALYTIDWAMLPLPQHLIKKEREMMSTSRPSTQWQSDYSNLAVHDVSGGGPVGQLTDSKKRKSSDLYASQAEETNDIPPWRKTNSRNIFESRSVLSGRSFAERLEKPTKFAEDSSLSNGSSKFVNGSLDKRQRRFESNRPGHTTKHPWAARDSSPIRDAEAGPVVGRSTQLEKKYFRLTSAPNPDTVRPLHVLQKTLEHLKRTWKKENNYSYVCDQFKSLRQDLTVQHIKNEFTVNVYEIHARIALEKGDLGGHPMEFKAYRILYFIHTCNRTDMNDVLADLTPTEKKDQAVKHALDMRSALALGNYHRFFRLYLETPNMGAYLVDMFVVRERLAALANICRGFITEELGFESDAESFQFLSDNNAQQLVEEREDGLRLLSSKAGSLFELAKRAAFHKVDIKGQI
ncbi:MAG: hypothetical protein M1825_005653 [Sarcosagium campestre]|nr:MAG: hypothetical protein M1825_005653 [Sarcosagium campestre]